LVDAFDNDQNRASAIQDVGFDGMGDVLKKETSKSAQFLANVLDDGANAYVQSVKDKLTRRPFIRITTPFLKMKMCMPMYCRRNSPL
jgi:hypothetical protein